MPTHLLYARRSSDAEDRQVLSIASQVHELQLLADRQGLSISRVFEESASARTPGRPVFAALLEQILKGKVVGVLCWKLDRLARNPVDGGAVIWALDSGKLTSIVTPERTFTNTGSDKFWLQLEFGIAKKYSDDLSENVKRGNRAKLEQGWIPGIPPIGYLNDRLSKTIVPDPDRFPLIRRLWELVLNGTSPRFALQTLNGEWGFRTRTMARMGGKPLSPSGLYRLLRDRFYYGLLDRGGQLYRGAHLPMITKEEFETVQSLLSRKRRSLVRRFFPYAQLLACGSCGAAITAELHTKPSGRQYTYYRCTRRRTGRPCHEQAVPGDRLEAEIRKQVRNLNLHPSEVPKALERIVGPRPNPRFLQVRERTREQTRVDLIRQRSRLIDLHLQGLIERDEYELRRSQLTASLDALGAELGEDASVTLSADQLRNRPFGEVVLSVLATAEPEAGKILLRKLGTWTLRDQQVHLEVTSTGEPREVLNS